MAAETETFVGASGELHDGTGFDLAWTRPGGEGARRLDAYDDGTVEGLGASAAGGAGDTYYEAPTAQGTDAMAYGRFRDFSEAKDTPLCAKVQDADNYAAVDVAGTGSIGTRIEVTEAGVIDDGDVRWQGANDQWVKIEVDASGNIEGFTGGTGASPSWTSEGSHATTAFGAETNQGLVCPSNCTTTFGSDLGKYYEVTFDALGGGALDVSGGVTAQNSASAGEIDLSIDAAGDVQAEASSSQGSVALDLDAQGDVQAEDATTAANLSVVADVAGDVQAQDASAEGGVGAELTVQGAVQAQSASAEGAVDVDLSVQGDVQPGDATAAGECAMVLTTSGAVQAADSTADGEVTGPAVDRTVEGDVQAQSSTAQGDLGVEITAQGSVQAQASTADGSCGPVVSVSGDVQAADAAVDGDVSPQVVVSGGVSAQEASVGGSIDAIAGVSGAVAANDSSVDGSVDVSLSVQGAVVAQDAVADGNAEVVLEVSGAVQAGAAATAGIVREPGSFTRPSAPFRQTPAIYPAPYPYGPTKSKGS